MVKPLSSTPPLFPMRPILPVRRRILFYFPGYDPDAERRYRTLFVREFRRYSRRFRVVRPKVSAATLSEDKQVQTWHVRVGDGNGETETTYAVMLWDDIVRRDMARPLFASTFLNACALLHVISNGTFFRIYKASWKCGCLILYPFVMTLLLAGCVLLLTALSHQVLSAAFGWPSWVSLTFGAVAGVVGLHKMVPWLGRAFLWQLMNDWVFNWQHANGRRPEYNAKLQSFADYIRARIRGTDAEEILLVGHSTGALTAVEVTARLLASDEQLGRDGPALSLLTLGSSLPIVALQPTASSTRNEIERLVASQRLVWVDYQAPQDWMNFPGFDPKRDFRLRVPAEQVANPAIRSAKFREIMDQATYRSVHRTPFRTHFQFLMANEFAGIYDIFALSLGNRCVRDRVITENSSTLGNSFALQGNIDEFDHLHIKGWAHDSSSEDLSIEIGIYIENLPPLILRADQFRGDLAQKGIGNGAHGFVWVFDPPLETSRDQVIAVRRLMDNFEIGRAELAASKIIVDGSPKTNG